MLGVEEGFHKFGLLRILSAPWCNCLWQHTTRRGVTITLTRRYRGKAIVLLWVGVLTSIHILVKAAPNFLDVFLCGQQTKTRAVKNM